MSCPTRVIAESILDPAVDSSETQLHLDLFTPPTTKFTSLVGPGPRYLFPPTLPTPLHGRCSLPPTSTNPTLLLFNLSPSPRRAVGLWQPNHQPSRVQSCTSRGDNQPSIFSLLVRGIYSCLSPLADSDFLLLATPHPPPPPLPSSPLRLLFSNILPTPTPLIFFRSGNPLFSTLVEKASYHVEHLLWRRRARWPPPSGL